MTHANRWRFLAAALVAFAVANTACAALTFTLASALPTDGVAPIWPSAMDAGFTGSMRVSAADTVEVRYCNLSGNSVDPAPQTFGARGAAAHNTIRVNGRDQPPSAPW
jgi:hypothetical protein